MQVLGRLQAALVEVLSPFNEYSGGVALSCKVKGHLAGRPPIFRCTQIHLLVVKRGQHLHTRWTVYNWENHLDKYLYIRDLSNNFLAINLQSEELYGFRHIFPTVSDS
jgi:hypothetical protein